MTVIPLSQAISDAQAAGFSGQSLSTIIGIARAESSLDTTAYNPTDPYGGSYGILQINGSHTGESFTYGVHTYIMSPAVAENPSLAFAFAYQLSKEGTFFNDWSTYTSGKYANLTQSTSGASSPVNTLASVTTLTDPSAWVRVGIGTLGVILIIAGAFAIVTTFTQSEEKSKS